MKKRNLLILATLFYSTILPHTIFEEALNGDKEAIRKRLDEGQDCTVKDKDGNTILHIAAQEGHEDIIDLVTEYFNRCGYWTYYMSYAKIPTLDETNDEGNTVLHAAIYGKNNDEKRVKVAEYVTNKKPQLMEKCNKKNISPAFMSIQKDDPRFIRIFTAHQLDLKKHTYNGETALTYAIKEKKPQSIYFCAEKTTLSNVANRDNKTPLLLAIDTGNTQLLTLFKENINTLVDHSDLKPIHYAASTGKTQALDYILNNYHISVDEPDKYGNPPTFYAVDSNDEQMLNHLLYLGADIKKRNNQGEDILTVAARNKHLNLVKLLTTKYNIDVNARDNNGLTSLMHACVEQNNDTMEQLISLGSNIRMTDNKRENILHKIARNGNVKGAHIALQQDKLLLKDSNKEGNIPLFIAIQNGNFALAQILLDSGSPVDTINQENETVLHEAVKKNNKPFLAELYKKVTSQIINQKNSNGETAIFFAIKNNDAATIKMLISRNAEYRGITQKDGLSPIHCAGVCDAVDALQELERHGANLTDRTAEGNTVAHIAAGYGKINMIRYLQSRGNVLEICNNKGENAFSYGAIKGQLEMTKTLLRDEYFINDTVSRTITSLKNSSSYVNKDVFTFLNKEHNDRMNKCKDIHNVYLQTSNLIYENQRSVTLLADNNFFIYFTYAPAQLEATSVNELYHMTEVQRTKVSNHYWKCKDKERNDQIRFEREINQKHLDQQNIIAKQKAEQERVRKQQQDELDRIAQENRQRAAQEKARLELQLQQQRETERVLKEQQDELDRIAQDNRQRAAANRPTEQERIAAQQGTSIAEQKAELDRLAQEKYTKDVAANNQRIADEKARQRAEEDARAKQARAAERERIAAENKKNAPKQQPAVVPVIEQGECQLCFETTTVEPVRCTHCQVGSARTCDACIQHWINNCKLAKKPLTCPFCNKATLSEKLKQ